MATAQIGAVLAAEALAMALTAGPLAGWPTGSGAAR